MFVSNDIKYIGVNDHEIDMFEGKYKVPDGISYNSYVILDEKIAVMDTVDASFTDRWLSNLEEALAGRKPDYLLVHHMEPDHSANMLEFTARYPEARIVASPRAFQMMKYFFGTDFEDRRIVANEGDRLSLGRHELSFIHAPMVHWPEVMMSYDSFDKALFTADAFGRFGALDVDIDWDDEARRYYIGIVAKYGVQVQNVLKKISALDLKLICPLHGPVLKNDLAHYLGLYDIWSSYRPEEDGLLIAYTSVYGNTKTAVFKLKELLENRGFNKVKLIDLARTDMSLAVSEAFRCSRLVLATTTYNGDIFPFMREFISNLLERNFSNRSLGFIENGSWAPMAAKIMSGMLEKSRNINYYDNSVRILSVITEENLAQLQALAEEIVSKGDKT